MGCSGGHPCVLYNPSLFKSCSHSSFVSLVVWDREERCSTAIVPNRCREGEAAPCLSWSSRAHSFLHWPVLIHPVSMSIPDCLMPALSPATAIVDNWLVVASHRGSSIH